jgi:hypothetical protein
MIMTPEDKKILVESINAAEEFGKCNYVRECGSEEGYEPVCVVGQIAFRLGITAHQMAGWSGGWLNYKALRQRNNEFPGHEPLTDFDNRTGHILEKLQMVWDHRTYSNRRPTTNTPEEARAKMLEIVEAAS